MASLPTHAAAALALGGALGPLRPPRRFWVWMAALAMAPDLDVAAFALGIPYAHPLGHRGFSHSLLAALLMAGAALAWERRRDPSISRLRWGGCFLVAALSHGLLDAMTSGGLGVGFFIPFEPSRHFLPWRPIRVSPIGVGPFLGARGLAVLLSEARWVGPPVLALGALAMLRRIRSCWKVREGLN